MVEDFLCTHASSANHGKTAVLKFLCLHFSEFGRISGLQAKGVKSNVSGVVVITKLPQSFGPVSDVRLMLTEMEEVIPDVSIQGKMEQMFIKVARIWNGKA